MFPLLVFPEPNDCIFVIRSMMCFVDAWFRGGRGGVIIPEAKRVLSPLALEKRGAIWFVSSVELSNNFSAKETQGEIRQPGDGQAHHRYHKFEGNSALRIRV